MAREAQFVHSSFRRVPFQCVQSVSIIPDRVLETGECRRRCSLSIPLAWRGVHIRSSRTIAQTHTHTFGSDGRIARQIIRVQSRDRFSREFKKRMASIGSTSYQKHRTDQWFVSGERRSTNTSSRVRTELRSHSGWVGETRGRAGTI